MAILVVTWTHGLDDKGERPLDGMHLRQGPLQLDESDVPAFVDAARKNVLSRSCDWIPSALTQALHFFLALQVISSCR